MKFHLIIGITTLAVTLSFSSIGAAADDLKVKITADIASVEVMHQGKAIKIMRNQDVNNVINPDFAKTSRPCPTFCIHPMTLAEGLETIGELELLDYLKKMSAGDNSIIVIDSRTPNWVAKGTIPGAINIPWDTISGEKADPATVKKILSENFGVNEKDFSGAKTLVMFCNGSWCDQSPTNIKTLLGMGYPAEKIKWYRGGMQAWESLGFVTVK